MIKMELIAKDNIRIDKYLMEELEYSRSKIQRMIDNDSILVNNNSIKSSYKLKIGDNIYIDDDYNEDVDIVPEKIDLDIVYEDEYLLVVNKPSGMVVHPAVGNYSGTLVNGLMYHCNNNLSRVNGSVRPGIVHSIDKDTSGVLVVAKNDIAHKGLAEQIKEHSFTRVYNTVVVGNIKDDFGTIDAPIGRHPKDRKKQAVTDKNSRNAVTHFEVLERYNGFTFLKVRLETGRTHQIRVHMAYRGTPVAGDVVYGNPKKTYGLQGQCLNASTIGFVHPITGEYLEFTTDLPDYFKDFLRRIS